jgi:tRNA dimethylallyltransferase
MKTELEIKLIHNNKFFLALYGPTAVGKTDLSDQLAAELPIEIINMDVGQLYTPLTIGTAKPDWQKATVPHHMFDILDEPRDYTVTEYRAAVVPLLEGVWARGRIPVFVGGSGFYLKSLLFPPEELEVVNKTTSEGNWHTLHAIDPVRAAAIHPNDTYRIQRALSIWQQTGTIPSDHKPCYSPIAPGIILDLGRNRTELYNRINIRTHEMITQGWIDETKDLLETPWQSFLYKKKLIGYTDIMNYLIGDVPLNDTIEVIQQKTRNYAKRQMTFSRMLKREINKADNAVNPLEIASIDLTLSESGLYIKKLIYKLKGME